MLSHACLHSNIMIFYDECGLDTCCDSGWKEFFKSCFYDLDSIWFFFESLKISFFLLSILNYHISFIYHSHTSVVFLNFNEPTDDSCSLMLNNIILLLNLYISGNHHNQINVVCQKKSCENKKEPVVFLCALHSWIIFFAHKYQKSFRCENNTKKNSIKQKRETEGRRWNCS